MRRLAMVGVLCAFGGAGGVAHAQGTGPVTDPHITDGTAQKQLDAARARWKAAGVKDYRFRAQVSCFCRPAKPRTITVRHGLPVHPPQDLADVASVPRMFRTIQSAITGKVAAITVTYGPRGVPSRIAIDVSRQIADEERYFTIDRFVRSTVKR